MSPGDTTLGDLTTARALGPEELEAWLDRLADGEVDASQRRALLSRLDEFPDGWRRCALAFLESQAWSEALGPEGFAEEPPNHHGSGMNVSPGPRPLSSRPTVAVVCAAASVMLAFGLGVVIQRAWLAGDTELPLAGSPNGSTHPIAKRDDPGDDPGRWGTVQFVVDGPGGTPEEVQLPAIEGPDPGHWLAEQPPIMPPEIIQQLRRLGHHVDTQRHYVPVPLHDGRRVLFPVDNVEVRLKGDRGYQ